jgi:ribosomal protein S18 acetylase RimI-like enzyme
MEITVEFRLVEPGDEDILLVLFAAIDQTFFRPHPFTRQEAHRIATHSGRDVYAVIVDSERPAAYGMLRGWDEGYEVPSLGVAVRADSYGRGLGRTMMTRLHDEASLRGAHQVRLRVHPDNDAARRLYESLGYRYAGEERAELVMVRDLRTHLLEVGR